MLNLTKALDEIIPHLPIARKSSVEDYAICCINLFKHLQNSKNKEKMLRKPRMACAIAPSQEIPDIRTGVKFLAELERLGYLETRSHKEGIKTIAEAYPTKKLISLLARCEPIPNIRRYPISVKDSQEEFQVRRGIRQDTVNDSAEAVMTTSFTINEFVFHLLSTCPPYTEEDAQYIQFDLAMKEAENHLYKKFKFELFLCSRGRMYDDSTVGFSTQGADYEKALVIPTTKYVLNHEGFEALLEAAHGFSGQNYTMAQMVNFAVSPLDTLAEWHTNADEPYQFISCCEMLRQYQVDPLTPLPAFIPLDGRCSGLQHWSALLKTSVIADRLGMTPEPNPDGLDMYEFVAWVWEQELPIELKMYATRKAAKKPVMTFAYSATRMSAMDWVDSLFGATKVWNKEHGKYEPQDDGLLRAETAKLGSHLFNVTTEVLAPMVEGVEWLKVCVKIIMDETNHPRIQWPTPDGFMASQYTVKWDRMKVQVRDSRKKMHKVNIRVPQMGKTGIELPSVTKAKSGIGPNIIHSLDATHLRMVASRLAELGIYGVWVHDSFSVHCNFRSVLYSVIVETFIELYSGNYLNVLKDYWEYHYRVNLPEPPAQGDWQPTVLRKCPEFFV